MKTAFPPDGISAAGMLVSKFLEIKSVLTNPGAPRDGLLPTAPTDFQPALRFVVCSDIHGQNARFCDMMQHAYTLADSDPVYPSLDAVLIAGDFTNSGRYEEMVEFHEALTASLRGNTKAVICLGNHEYIDSVRRHHLEHGTTEEKFSSLFAMEPDSVTKINGYTFLAVSYDSSGKQFRGREKQKFYRTAIDRAKKESPDKPIFVIQHPHPFLTVYGSVNWAEIGLSRIWRKTAHVVNFSGHSHYPMNDPRSVWQGSYTALGTGSLKYFEMENNLVCGWNSAVPDSAEQCYLVEADAQGNLLVRCYDLYSHDFFGETYFFPFPCRKDTFRYTYANRMRAFSPPHFSDDSLVCFSRDERGHYRINFSAADDRQQVHDYRIVLTGERGGRVLTKSILSESCLIERTPKYLSADIGGILKKGETYRVKIYACDSFWRLSKPLRARFTVSY